MARSWITPKTDWIKSDEFTIVDYNRIRNNLLYINDMLNERYPDKAQPLDLGDAMIYSGDYYPSKFNAFEDALESFTRIGTNVNIGSKKTFKGNDPFIGYKELNRLEECCLRWHDLNPVITSVSLSPSIFEFGVSDTQQLTLTVTPSNAEYTVLWASSDSSVASVSNSGLVTGVNGGIAIITATVKQQGRNDIVATSRCGVIVPVTAISITPSDMDLTYYETKNYQVTVTPSDATHKDDYELVVVNPDIVSIWKGNKTIQAKESGKTQIIASVDNVSSSMNITSMTNRYINSDGAVVFNNKIHVFGGSEVSNYESDVDKNLHHAEWDEETYEWVDLPNKPYQSNYAGVVVYNNEIHLMGGGYGSQKYDYHYIWNGTSWRTSTPLPFANRSFALVVYNNEIHMLGGYYGLTKHYKWNGSVWSEVSVLPKSFLASKGNGAVVYNNEIHLIGGYNTNIGHYKWNGSAWQQASSLPMIAQYIPSVVYNSKIHILGGYNSSDGSTRYRHYSWNGTSWTRESDTRCQTSNGNIVVYNDKIFAFDGGNSTSIRQFNDGSYANMFIVDE